jgi:hypothetical protein
MQTGKRGLSVLQDLQLHALGLFRDVPGLMPNRPEAATATAPPGCYNESTAIKAALECKKAEARYQAQRLLTHPR